MKISFHTFLRFSLLLSLVAHSSILQAQSSLFLEWQRLVSPQADNNDNCGNAVDIDGTYAIVGAYKDDLPTGIGQSIKTDAGSATIFELDSFGIWQTVHWIDNAGSSNSQSAPLLGYSVSISGNYAVVGLPEDDEGGVFNDPPYATKGGSVLVFERNVAGAWIVKQSIRPSDRKANDHFGRSVSISSDGLLIVGAEGRDVNQFTTDVGCAYVYVRNSSGVWILNQTIQSPVSGSSNYHFGWSCALDGERAIIGTNTWKSAHVYVRVNGTWILEDILTPNDVDLNDKAGFSVAISGDYCILGAYSEKEDANGGNQINNAGAAYIFERSGSTWIQTQKLIPSQRGADHIFGYSVDIDEDRCLVGAPGWRWGSESSGAVFIYELDNTTWNQMQVRKSPHSDNYEEFGNAVALDGNSMIVGTPGAFPSNGTSRTGNAQSFHYCPTSDGTWPIISQSFNELSVNSSGSIYQWMTCDSIILEGATNQTYTPVIDGSYRVIVIDDRCRDTSDCFDVTLGIQSPDREVKIDLFPNPTNSIINLVKPSTIKSMDVQLLNALGQELQNHPSINSTNYQISLVDLDAGIYFIRFRSSEVNWTQQVIKL